MDRSRGTTVSCQARVRWGVALAVALLLLAGAALLFAVAAPAASAEPGHITGHVSDGTGTGLPLTLVQAYRWSEYGWWWGGDTWADADGDYDITVDPGVYRVRFTDYTWTHADVCYGGARTLEGGLDVPVGDGQTVSGIDVTLLALLAYPRYRLGR